MNLFSFFSLLCLAALASPPVQCAGAVFSSVQRLQRDHLQATHETRLRFARERQDLANPGPYQDFRAVIHVHAEDSEHTKGTRQEVLEAARKTGVQVVLFTDHGGPHPETWRGVREGVLFIAGAEHSRDGLLRFPRFGPEGVPLAEGELRFLSHIEERYEASADGFHGMEISNRHTDAKLDRALQIHLAIAMANSRLWENLVRNFETYPDEFFGAGVDYRTEIFAKWDRETQKKRFTGIGANDAHQNQIFKGVTFDPYEVSFRNLTTHILARELTEGEILGALREGRAYVSHDWLCDPTGFAFGAANKLGTFHMGEEAPLFGATRIFGKTPLPATLKLFRNGVLTETLSGTDLTFRVSEPGAYRLEAWLEVVGEKRPWIYSNPVYVRAASP